MRRSTPQALVLVMLLLVGIPIAGAQETSPTDPPPSPEEQTEFGDIRVPGPEGVQVAVQLSQQTDTEGVQRVLLASDSSFADALASAVLQQTGPLLLVPSSLPIPGEVTAELQRLDPEEVVLLGGESAISEEVEVELRRLGFVTNRLSGPTRLDTAVEIARTRPNAVTALLVRAFDSSGGNGTGAWADSVAAGAFSAQNGLPILLTETDALSQPTREHLSASGVRTVIIIGGVSAVSAEVEAQLRADGLIVSRIAGATRFETALAIGQSLSLIHI